jgi:hypothetical protein
MSGAGLLVLHPSYLIYRVHTLSLTRSFISIFHSLYFVDSVYHFLDYDRPFRDPFYFSFAYIFRRVVPTISQSSLPNRLRVSHTYIIFDTFTHFILCYSNLQQVCNICNILVVLTEPTEITYNRLWAPQPHKLLS